LEPHDEIAEVTQTEKRAARAARAVNRSTQRINLANEDADQTRRGSLRKRCPVALIAGGALPDALSKTEQRSAGGTDFYRFRKINPAESADLLTEFQTFHLGFLAPLFQEREELGRAAPVVVAR